MADGPTVGDATPSPLALRLLLAWASALGLAWLCIFVLRIGPVIMVVSEQRGMGVHTGDFLGFIPPLAAFLYSWRSLRDR